MQNNNIDDLFEGLKNRFDVKTPNTGHTNRFLEKLNTNTLADNSASKPSGFNWKPLLAIAASVVICFSVFITTQNQSQSLELASVSPELSKTQDFFTVTIENELKKLTDERSPSTELIINDALKHIQILETNYQTLQTDLKESGNDQRVIHAMISNFQNRIEILNTVLQQIEAVKQLKTMTNAIAI